MYNLTRIAMTDTIPRGFSIQYFGHLICEDNLWSFKGA